jgi:methionyl-tRNA formyltransferase
VTRIVILTSSELRHDFFRKALALAPRIEVLRSYREGLEKALRTTIDPVRPGAVFQTRHLALREASEQDFFGPFVALTPDHSKPVSVARGAVNEPAVCEEILRLGPDLLVAYGPSLIRDPLLSAYAGRFLNIHLGLSPYYRGSGTNFWPPGQR